MMALERSKADEITALKDKLEDAMDAVADGKQQAVLARDTLRAELDKMVKERREEKATLVAKIERMRVELEKRESELERSESIREQLEQQLAQAKDDDKLARGKNAKALEEAQAAKINLEQEVTSLKQELKESASKEAARERIEQELGLVKTELDDFKIKTTKAIEVLRDEKQVAESALEVAQQELRAEMGKPATLSADDEDKKRLEAEVQDVSQQLAAAEDKIKQLESRDVVSADQARADVEKVEQLRREAEKDFREAVEEIQRLEKDREVLLEQLAAFETKESEWAQKRQELEQVAAEGEAELVAMR